MRRKGVCLIYIIAPLVCAAAAATWLCILPRITSPVLRQSTPVNVAQLLTLPSSTLSNLDIARMNLLCAEGFSISASEEVNAGLATLDIWAARIGSETARHAYRFQRDPAEFNHSEGFFRMLIMAVVLAEDFHVEYDPSLRMPASSASSHDGFFRSAHSVFLSGLLGPERKGTCSSLPVLYVALGRRLGYPLYLVTTKGHLFVRWDGKGERFNVEATSHGLNTFDDDYYRQWPFPITAEEESAEGYLKSLDVAGELGVFLSIRGMCLRENGRVSEAAEAFAKASELAPQCRTYAAMHAQLAREAHNHRSPELTVTKGKSL